MVHRMLTARQIHSINAVQKCVYLALYLMLVWKPLKHILWNKDILKLYHREMDNLSSILYNSIIKRILYLCNMIICCTLYLLHLAKMRLQNALNIPYITRIIYLQHTYSFVQLRYRILQMGTKYGTLHPYSINASTLSSNQACRCKSDFLWKTNTYTTKIFTDYQWYVVKIAGFFYVW